MIGTGPSRVPASSPLASGKPSNLREETSFRSTIARGEKIACNAARISGFRWSMPREEVCTTSTSSYLSTISPLRKSLSALTTRKEVAAGKCRWRMANAARMRSSKKAWFVSTRSGERTRTLILDSGVIETGAQKALAMVFDLHQLAIGGGLREPEDGTMINPRMAGQDAVGFARFQQNSRQ